MANDELKQLLSSLRTIASSLQGQYQHLLRHSHDRPRTIPGSGELPLPLELSLSVGTSNSLLTSCTAPRVPCSHSADTLIQVSLGWSAQTQAILLLFHDQTIRMSDHVDYTLPLSSGPLFRLLLPLEHPPHTLPSVVRLGAHLPSAE